MNIKPIFLAVFFILLFSFASAKSFSFDSAKTDYIIEPNGLVYVTETMKVNFSGDFTYGYRELPLAGNQTISNPQAFVLTNAKSFDVDTPFESLGAEAVSITLKRSGGIERIDYSLPSTGYGGTYIIVLKYGLTGAVTKYEDVAELNWKVWGDQWDAQLPLLQGSIKLPSKVSNPKDVYTYGHPELNGRIGMLSDNRTIVFETRNVPAEQWVEVRSVFPASLITSDVYVNKASGKGLEKIEGEEQAYSYGGIFIMLLYAAAALSLAGTFIYIFLKWWRSGRDPEVDVPGTYYREPPYDYSPSIVSALLHDRRMASPNTIMGGILDLCMKGFITLERIEAEKFLGVFGREYDYKIHFTKEPGDEITAEQKMIYGWLRKADSSETLYGAMKFTAFENYIKRNSSESRSTLQEWQKEVKKEVMGLGLFNENKLSKKEIAGLVVFGGIPSFILFFMFFSLLILLVLAFVLFMTYLPARTMEG